MRLQPLRHPFDPNAYLEDPQQQPATQDQPSADPPHALPRPVSSVGLNKPLPQPGAFPQVAQPEAHLAYHQNPNGTASAPPQMSYSASFPGVHAHTQHYSPPPHMQAASSVYQPMPPQPSAHSPTPPHPTLAQQPSPLYPQPPVSTSPRPLPVPASHTAPPAQPFDVSLFHLSILYVSEKEVPDSATDAPAHPVRFAATAAADTITTPASI